MRDLDETNLRNKKGDLDPFADIEHMNSRDEFDAFDDEPRMMGSSFDTKNADQEFESKQYSFAHKKKMALSLLSKRTMLVSIVVLIGFGGIFMWSWIFEVLGFISWTGTENPDKNKSAIAEVITLPAQDPASQLAMAPAPVQAHARAPKVKETTPNSLPTVSKTTNAAQGISMGGTRVENKNIQTLPASQELKSEVQPPAVFAPRLEPRRVAPVQNSQPPEAKNQSAKEKDVLPNPPILKSDPESTKTLPKNSQVEAHHPQSGMSQTPISASHQGTESSTDSTQPIFEVVRKMPVQSNPQMSVVTQEATNIPIEASRPHPEQIVPMKSEVAQTIIEKTNKDQEQQQKLIEEKLNRVNATTQEDAPPSNSEKSKPPKTPAKTKQDTLLLNRKPDHFTIQILGMQDEQKLKAFMNQSVLKSKMSSYQTLRDGKPWHVLVYGDFETKQQADQALLNLPLDIQKNKPWVRPMREVQGAIRAKS